MMKNAETIALVESEVEKEVRRIFQMFTEELTVKSLVQVQEHLRTETPDSVSGFINAQFQDTIRGMHESVDARFESIVEKKIRDYMVDRPVIETEDLRSIEHPMITTSLMLSKNYSQMYHFGTTLKGGRDFTYQISNKPSPEELVEKVMGFAVEKATDHLIKSSLKFQEENFKSVDLIYVKDMKVKITAHNYNSKEANYQYQVRVNAAWISVNDNKTLLQDLEPAQLVEFSDFDMEDEWTNR